MRMIEAILFDLDGVLINSFESWYHAFNGMLKAYGKKEMGRAEFSEKCWGPDLEHNLLDLNLGEEAGKYCINEQLKLIELIELFPGAKAVLNRVREEYKLKVGLVTNTPKDNVRGIFKHFQLSNLFDVVVTGDDVRNGKPDAEMVMTACEKLTLKPEHVLLVGDTEVDFQAAKSAGCAVVGMRAKPEGGKRIDTLFDLFPLLTLNQSF